MINKKLAALRDCFWLRDILSSAVFFCVMVGLDVGVRWIYRGNSITYFFALVPWVSTLSWALMVTSLLRLLPQIPQRIAIGMLGGLFNLLYLVNCLMFQAKANFFSFSSLIFAADGFKFLDASYIQVRKLVWIFLFCGIAATVLAAVLVPPGRRGGRQRALSLVMAALCILAINVNREKNLTDRLAPHFDIHQASLLYEDFSNSVECLPLTGLYQYTFRDFCITYGVYNRLNRIGHDDIIKNLDNWYASKTPDPDNQWTGRFKGKNLILIQLEAIDTWMINEEFMPNLYRLQQESLDFVQHYTPVYYDAGTFNTEMIVNTGLVSPFIGTTSSMYSRNAYPDSLAHLMTAEGYTANSFHRSGGDVYNRGEVHENWGYAHYYSGVEMGMENRDLDTEMLNAYDIMTPDSPFLTFIITYSAHGPYADSYLSAHNYEFAAQRLPEGCNEMLIHSFAHAYETDLFVGQLCDRLEADGLLDNTVLVFYADHYNYYALDTDLIMEQKGVNDKNMMTRTPFFIYEKGTPEQKIDKVGGSIDILPTIANLFGLNTDGTHYVGNDFFSGSGGYVIFADYSWYDGETYWNALGSEPPTDVIAVRSEELRNRLEMSWDTMRYDYFSK